MVVVWNRRDVSVSVSESRVVMSRDHMLLKGGSGESDDSEEGGEKT